MLGDEDTEKTSLTIRYISGFFLDDLKLTIGVDFYSKTTNYHDKKVKLQIWDFGGEECFRFLLHQYCKGANAAFFLYNITNPHALDNLSDWTQLIRGHAGDIPIMLVGTNVDLKDLRAVTREEGVQAAIALNLAGFIEVSSKTGLNVEKLFDVITEMLFDRYRPDEGEYYESPSALKVNKPIFHKPEIADSIKEGGKKKIQKIISFLKKSSNWLTNKISRILEDWRYKKKNRSKSQKS